MEARRYGNWIGGRELDPAGGGAFELRSAREPFESLGTWPRSDEPELAAALESARDAAAEWARLPERPRRGVLRRTYAAVQAAAPLGSMAARIGLEPGALEPYLRAGLAVPERWTRPAEGARRTAGSVWLHVNHWTGLAGAPGRAILPLLAAGGAVLWLADARLPQAGELWGRALADAGAPPGLLSVLHGVPGRLRRRAAAEPGLAGLDAQGTERELDALLEGAPEGLELRLGLLRNRSLQVGTHENLEVAARRAATRAFGRTAAFSGQRPGQVGRVLCHERVFSAFTGALLAELRRNGEMARPVPLIDEQALEEARAACALGLDEGATMIAGGEPSGDGGPRRPPRSFPPVVFTNVEAEMQIAHRSAPAPILCLLRVPSEEAGDDLAEELG